MTETCATCRFWDVYEVGSAFSDSLDAGKIGDCRRRAPRISDELLRRTLPGPNMDQFGTLANDLYLPSAFPVTAQESWCGEYEPPRGPAALIEQARRYAKSDPHGESNGLGT